MIRRVLCLLLVWGCFCLSPVWAVEEAASGHGAVAVEEAGKAAHEAQHVYTHEAHKTEHAEMAHKVHEGGPHEVKPHVTKQQLRDLLWWGVNFLALVIILVKFGREPLLNTFRSRREGIESEYKELSEKRAEAEAKYREYEKKLATLEEEAKKIMEAFIEQGQKEKERIIKEAQETAERIKQQAEFYVQQELEKARAELRKEVAEMSVKLAEQIIKEKITPEDHKRLVKEFIERVVH